MLVNFYEEFPTKENLKKLKLIKFKTQLFVASKSLEMFKELEKQIKKINKKTQVSYWPIVKNSYWISPFSNTKDLIELFRELERINNHLLIDLELPMLNKRLMLKNWFCFFKNKRLIKKFLEKNKKRITTAQYPFLIKFQKALGLNYNVDVEKSYMYYTSMIPKSALKKFQGKIKKIRGKKDYSISLGTIATGILGNEPILSPKNLEKDLDFVEKAGFKKVIIFRLGGLNREYIKVINRFHNK